MAVRLEGIHFLVTYRCTYACDHCFVWGSPDADGTMTLAQLTSVIDQAAELGVTDVYFEGGEPTLAYPIVLAAAQRAREHGLDVGIVSNCFWATSVADAKVWLAPFAELGVADLSLSSYAYFVEDANEEQLRNAVLAARELGIPVSVLEVGAPADIGVPGACSGDVGEVMHKGRAAVALAPARASRPPETLITCPFEDFTDPGRAHVGPDGELQVCQGISAGNVFAGGDGPPAPEDLAEPRPDGLRRGARRLRPARPPRHPRDPRRRPLGPRPGRRPRAGALTVRRRMSPMLRSPRRAAPRRPLPRGGRAGPVLRRERGGADDAAAQPRRRRPCRLSANTSGTPAATPSSATRPARSRTPRSPTARSRSAARPSTRWTRTAGPSRATRPTPTSARCPARCEAAVLELPKEETAAWVAKAADAGVERIWIHQMTDTPEALAEAEKRGLKVITGHCAVMYNKPGMSMHAPHRWIWKLLGKY